MKKIIAASLLILAAIAALGLSSAAAEELWVIKDGVLDKEALTPAATEIAKDHVSCGGETVDGLYVSTPNAMGRPNWARFTTAKSAVGDCEFKVIFSCAVGRPQWRFPNITITDRARLYFWKPGSPILLSNKKMSLPLENFQGEIQNGPFDGNLHSMAINRVGDKLSCYYDGKKLHEQPIDPGVRLHLWFDALHTHVKIKSIKLTAEKLSDDLSTDFKSAAPIAEIFQGSGVREQPEYGKACRYRIPALAVSKKGTILAFAEARRTGGADIGDIDAVVKRSTDGGKTWGPEIVIWDDEGRSVNNPSAVVDPKTGRIWLFMGHWNGSTPSQHAAFSDDDGETWSKSQEMTRILHDQIKDGRRLVIPGPGSGIALTRGPHAGRLIIPMNHGAAWGPSVVYSDDGGKTWKPGGALHANIGESKCAELSDGSVLFVGNPGPPETRRRLTIIAEGGTKNATEMWHAEELKHASCQGAVERHSWPEGDKPGLLLYSGPGVEAARAQGTLRGSYDEGKTWPWKQTYYEGGSGYSDVCVLPDGRVAVLFEKDGKSNLGFTILPAPPAAAPGPPAAADKAADKAPEKADAAPAKQPRDALLFLIAGDKNAEGQAAFSKQTNTAAGIETNWRVMPGSTAADIGLPVHKDAYPNSFIWSLANNRFEPLTPGANLLANVRRRGRAMGDPNRHGVELPVAHRLQKQFPGKDIFFVKVAEEGAALYQEWKPGDGTMYRKLIDAYQQATADLQKRYAKVKVLGLYWDQCEGEFDFQVGVEPMKKYPEHLAAFVKAIRADTKQPQLRIFMLKQMFHKVQPAWQPVVTAQRAFCKEDPNGVLIDIDRGRYGMNMNLWSWTSNWTSLSSKAYAAVADRIATEVMLAEREANKRIDGSPNTKRPAIVFLIAGQSNAGGTATLSIAHRKVCGSQDVWPADPEIAGENCGVPVADEAYKNCWYAKNQPAFWPIAPASAIKAREATLQPGKMNPKGEYRHGIELPAAHRLHRQFPDNDIYLIKVYGGGKNLHTNWNPDVRGQFFDLFMRSVPPALSQLAGRYPEVRVVGLYWDQGESDTGPEAVRYEGIYRKLVARIRAAARLPNLKVFARKHIYYHHVPGGPIINQALATVAAQDPNAYVLDIDLGADVDNEPNFDAWACTFRNIHIGSKAFKELTRLIFDECIPEAAVKDFVLYKP